MNFKDFLKIDCNTFINLEEFAEIKNLNGYQISIVETYTLAESKANYSVRDGISPKRHGANFIGENLLIYFKTCDYPLQIPKSTEFVNYENKRYKVVESLELDGITRLTLTTDSMQPARN